MRGSLSGVRARIDRLASRLHRLARTGCPGCLGKEDTPCVLCYYGSAVPDIPAESQCETMWPSDPVSIRVGRVQREHEARRHGMKVARTQTANPGALKRSTTT